MAYTENQQKAIEKGAGNVMVSASAGSGKTTVMVERILSLIEGGADVTEILAITFTRKAAAEMREKLRLKICARLASGLAKSEEHLTRQIRLLPLASVDTIHSFCRSLLKSYFYAADLDPAFELLSDTEAQQLKDQAIEEVFSKAYEERSSDFLRTVRYFSRKRKDSALKERILQLSEFADSEEDPSAWLSLSQREYYTPAGRAQVNKELTRLLKRRMSDLAESFAELIASGEKLGIPDKTLAVVAEWKISLSSLAEATELYALLAALASFAFLGRINLPKDKTAEQESWKGELEKAKKRLTSAQDSYALFGSAEEDARRAQNAELSLSVILRLVTEYRAAYARIKKENNRVDFSDLEHFTVQLLEKEEVRRSVAERYRYVFVDEYQDVNAVQERIVSQIARDNLFIVGDVKQSIYGFRGCNPDLFLGKMHHAKDGELIELNDNFRSAEAVINAANTVFCRAMTQESCDISYEKTEKLIYGTTVPAEIAGENCSSAEAVYYPTKKEKGETAATLYSVKRAAEHPEDVEERAEAVCIAKLISSLIGKEMIPDPEKRGEVRPVRYGDIAILFRGKKDARVLSAVEALKRRSIPAVCEVDEKITQSPEIALLTSLLMLSRNGEEDVPFVTVLLSPVGGLTETDLTFVRKGAEPLLPETERRNCSFTRAAALYAASPDEGVPMVEQEIKRKLRATFALVQELKVKAAFLPAGELLSELINRYSLTSYFLGKRLGKRRIARVNRLLAECLDMMGKPLSVAELLHRLEKGEDDFTLTESGVGDAVRIMTMHASKGLEFPVVILAGMEKQFNAADAREAIVASRSRGIVPLSFFEEDMSKRESALRFLVKEELTRRTVKEEMRLFYVAMTRAQNRLFVVLPDTTASTFSAARVKNARSLSDFLSRDVLPERVIEEQVVESQDLRQAPLTGNDGAKEAIKKVISFTYPNEKATQTPLKRTVTQMVQAEHVAAPVPAEKKDSSPLKNTTATPAPYGFGVESGDITEEFDLQAALFSGDAYTEKQRKGIRMHAFLETCNLSATTLGEVENAIRERISQGVMEQEDLTLAPVLSRILSSPLFASFAGKRILREKEFTMRLYEDGMGKEEGSVLQGVIDLLALGEKEGVLVDYKYSSRKAQDIWQTYRLQLDLYARAAEAFYGIKIVKRVIINLTNGEMIEGRGEDLCSTTY